MVEKILIIGASARAAVQSAHRAGLVPYAVDLFCDQDLLALCWAKKIANYPHEFIAASDEFPDCPWMYGGAIENYPNVIQAISQNRILLGNHAATVRRVRNPRELSKALRQAGVRYPEIAPDGQETPAGSWLRKPIRSGGGHGIQHASSLSSIRKLSRREHGRPATYLQQYLPGDSYAAVFVAASGDATLLGLTRQLIGTGCDRKPFAYAGSIGPLEISDVRRAQLERIGKCIARDFGVIGLFGVDLIECESDWYVVEVNPRYTASVEILERGLGILAIDLHVQCCVERQLPLFNKTKGSVVYGKRIVYASRAGIVPGEFVYWAQSQNENNEWPVVADIPAGDSSFQPLVPVCTVFAEGRQVDDIDSKLSALAEQVMRMVEA